MDTVKLSIPALPDYVVTVRLVASSIAGRLGYDIEQIDDIKMAVAEACLLLIPVSKNCLELNFSLNDGLEIVIAAQFGQEAEETPERTISQSILEALVDTVELINTAEQRMYKLIKK
jgi:serine/threonine-protein kinase RsbW